jgi:hypothetical protein
MCTDDGAAMEAALTAVTVNAAALAARKTVARTLRGVVMAILSKAGVTRPPVSM